MFMHKVQCNQNMNSGHTAKTLGFNWLSQLHQCEQGMLPNRFLTFLPQACNKGTHVPGAGM